MSNTFFSVFKKFSKDSIFEKIAKFGTIFKKTTLLTLGPAQSARRNLIDQITKNLTFVFYTKNVKFDTLFQHCFQHFSGPSKSDGNPKRKFPAKILGQFLAATGASARVN